jgi:hypothetical protein
MYGTASLANRDFGRGARTNRREVVFSGAPHHANEAAGAGYSTFWAENPQRQDSLAEQGEFELPVPICEQSDVAPCLQQFPRRVPNGVSEKGC